MKRNNIMSLLTGLLLFIITASAGGCSEGISATDYASQIVDLYGDYSSKFDEVSDAASKGQRVTAMNLCDEAADIIDKIDAIEPPVAFRDENKIISECCKKEKEKLDLEKEYLKIAKEEGNLTDEQTKRLEEIQEKASVLSLESEKFYNVVQKIADKTLQTQTQAPAGHNMLEDGLES